MVQRIIYAVCSLLAFVQGVNAQFLWEETHPSNKDRTSYYFHSPTGMSSFGDVISVMGFKLDSTQIVQESGSYNVWRSKDDGKIWELQDLGLPRQSFNTFTSSFTLKDIQQITALHSVVVGKDIGNDSALYLHTFDGGKTWNRLSVFDKGSNMAVHFSDSLNGVVELQNDGGHSQYFYTTIDGGKSFTKTASLNTSWGFVNCCSYGNHRFRGLEQLTGKVFSNLTSVNTIDSTSPIADADVAALYWFRACEFSGDTIIAYGSYSSDGTFRFPDAEGVIARSSDGGNSWSQITRFPQFYTLLSGTIPNNDTVLVTGGNSLQRSLYLLSTDNGITWKTDTLSLDPNYLQLIEDIDITGMGTPIAISTIMSPGISPTIIARGTRTTTSVKTNRNATSVIVYPNPATTSLQILSDTPNSTIRLVDLLGRTVMTQTVTAYEITLDVSKLPRGMYQVLIGNSVEKILLAN